MLCISKIWSFIIQNIQCLWWVIMCLYISGCHNVWSEVAKWELPVFKTGRVASWVCTTTLQKGCIKFGFLYTQNSQPRWLSGLMRSRVHSLWLLVDHCVLRNWDRILVRAVKGLISRAGMVSIFPLLWQRDVKLQQTNKQMYTQNINYKFTPLHCCIQWTKFVMDTVYINMRKCQCMVIWSEKWYKLWQFNINISMQVTCAVRYSIQAG